MIELTCIVLVCIIALIHGGKISNIKKFDINGIELLLLIVLIRVVQEIEVTYTETQSAPLLFSIMTIVLWVAIAWLNSEYQGLILMAIGEFSNRLAIYANDGKMPVKFELIPNIIAVEAMTESTKNFVSSHSIMTEATKFKWLCDIILVPGFNASAYNIMSIGDILLVLGLSMVLYKVIRGR